MVHSTTDRTGHPAAGIASARAVLTLLAVEAGQRLRGAGQFQFRPALLGFIIDPTGREREFAISVVARHAGVPVHRVDMSMVVQGAEAKNNFTRMFFAAERAGVILYFDHADALFNAPGPTDEHPFGRFEPEYLLQRLDSFAGVVIAAIHRKEMIAEPLLKRARHVVDFTPRPARSRSAAPAGGGA
jgi:SpoVK/Ycf46/Vps4 family AAA+-type ATPase